MSYTVAKYLRVSDEDIDLDGMAKQESNSIVGQRDLLDNYIQSSGEFSGWDIVEHLDDGNTGTNFSRPGIKELLELARTGQVNCIMVKDLSRFGRNYIEVGDYLEQKFPTWGVRLISLGDNYDSAKLHHGTSNIDVAFRNLVYDLYSQDLSVKCRTGKDAATKGGKIICSFPTFGYDKDPADKHKFVIDPLEAPLVQRIFRLAIEGHIPSVIVKMLNAEGVPTKQMGKERKGYKRTWGRGDCWDNSAVLDTLKNECYTGKWIYGKTRTIIVGQSKTRKVPKSEWIILPDAIPVLVSQEQFDLVQERLAAITKKISPKRVSDAPRTMFASLVKCAKCGRNLDYWSRKTQAGAFYCKTSHRTNQFGCTSDRVEEVTLAELVLTVLQKQVALATDKQEQQQLSSRLNQHAKAPLLAEIKSLSRFIEQAKQTKVNLWEKYHGEAITLEKFKTESQAITVQVSAYEEKIAVLTTQLNELSQDPVKENPITAHLQNLSGITELTREVLLTFVKEIKIRSPEQIEIVWTFADVFH